MLSNIDTVRERLAALPCRVYYSMGRIPILAKLCSSSGLITGLVLGVAILREHDKETAHAPGGNVHALRSAGLSRWGRRARNHCSRAGILSRSSLCILSPALSQELEKAPDGEC